MDIAEEHSDVETPPIPLQVIRAIVAASLIVVAAWMICIAALGWLRS